MRVKTWYIGPLSTVLKSHFYLLKCFTDVETSAFYTNLNRNYFVPKQDIKVPKGWHGLYNSNVLF